MARDKTTEKPLPLPEHWTKALLDAPLGPEGDTTIGKALDQAREVLGRVVTRARVFLATSPLVPLVAEAAAKEAKAQGIAQLTMDDLGNIGLAVAKGRKAGTVPTLDALRTEAQEAGADISACGRSRRKLLQAIQEAGKKVTPAPIPKRIKTAPAIGPVTIVYPEETSLAPDLLEKEAGPEPAPAPTSSRKSRLKLAEKEAGEIDLNAILGNVSR